MSIFMKTKGGGRSPSGGKSQNLGLVEISGRLCGRRPQNLAGQKFDVCLTPICFFFENLQKIRPQSFKGLQNVKCLRYNGPVYRFGQLHYQLLSGRSIAVVLLLAVEIWSVKNFFWFRKNFYSVNSLQNPLGPVYENPYGFYYGFYYGFCKKIEIFIKIIPRLLKHVLIRSSDSYNIYTTSFGFFVCLFCSKNEIRHFRRLGKRIYPPSPTSLPPPKKSPKKIFQFFVQ